MKVLIDHQYPFLLMHGGFQIQIQQTRDALAAIGVEADYLRWWDESQPADIIHFFGKVNPVYLNFCRQKKIKMVMSQLLTGLGSRSAGARRVQKTVIRAAETLLPRSLSSYFGWEAYRDADLCIALTSWEAHLLTDMFGVAPEQVRVVPNGVEDAFLQSRPQPRDPWLVCTATITERKRVLEIAEAAVQGQTPLWIVGKPYADNDPYAARYLALAKQHPKILRYEGAINDRARLAGVYREARGFVLLSSMESLSLSALEAAACECPLLLSDLPWARTVFKDDATYCPLTTVTSETAAILRRFYDAAPGLKPPPRPLAWTDVARQLKAIYESLCRPA